MILVKEGVPSNYKDRQEYYEDGEWKTKIVDVSCIKSIEMDYCVFNMSTDYPHHTDWSKTPKVVAEGFATWEEAVRAAKEHLSEKFHLAAPTVMGPRFRHVYLTPEEYDAAEWMFYVGEEEEINPVVIRKDKNG